MPHSLPRPSRVPPKDGPVSQEQFVSLMRRLKDHGYNFSPFPSSNSYTQQVGIESAPIVLQLLNALETSTARVKDDSEVKTKELALWQNQVEPLRKENGRLLREVNQLHMDALRHREASEASARQQATLQRRAESQSADAKFMASQLQHKVRSLEKERDSLATRLERLMGGGTPVGLPHMNSDPIPLTEGNSTHFSPPDPYVADLLRVADGQIATLQRELEAARESKSGFEVQVAEASKQIEARDEEIERLASLLRGGRDLQAVASEYAEDNHRRLVDHLNSQIDFLNEKLANAEQVLSERDKEMEGISKLRKSHEKLRTSMDRHRQSQSDEQSSKAQKELEHARILMQRWEAERKAEAKTAQETIAGLSKQVDQLKRDAHDSTLACSRAKEESREAIGALESLRRNQEELINKTNRSEEERRTADIKAYAAENEAKHMTDAARESRRALDLAATHAATATAEAERLRNEMSELSTQKNDREEQLDTAQRQLAITERTLKQCQSELDELRLKCERMEIEKAHQQDLLAQIESRASGLDDQTESTKRRIEGLLGRLERVQDERDFVQAELDRANASLTEQQSAVAKANDDAKRAAVAADVARAEAERLTRILPDIEAEAEKAAMMARQAAIERDGVAMDLDALRPYEARVIEQEQHITRLLEKVGSAETELAAVRRQLNQSRSNEQEIARSLEVRTHAAAELRADRDGLAERAAASESKAADAMVEMQATRAEFEEMKSLLEATRTDLTDWGCSGDFEGFVLVHLRDVDPDDHV